MSRARTACCAPHATRPRAGGSRRPTARGAAARPRHRRRAMTDPWNVLTSKQIEVARTFVAAREAERKHLVIYLSGAHAYGFPSPDSDLDLKCVHVAATRDLVGLDAPDDNRDRMEVVDGVELDYGSNELGQALRGSIKGNGNVLERPFGE